MLLSSGLLQALFGFTLKRIVSPREQNQLAAPSLRQAERPVRVFSAALAIAALSVRRILALESAPEKGRLISHLPILPKIYMLTHEIMLRVAARAPTSRFEFERQP